MSRRWRVAALVVCASVLSLTALPAQAADNGNWQSAWCGDRGEICNWRGNYGDESYELGSSTRDSAYNNDYYNGNYNYVLNDKVRNYSNAFSTLKVRSYHDYNYVRGSTCLNPGYIVGPYAMTSPDGLSSFKSC